MFKNKPQIVTAGLLLITLGLVIAIVYISQTITSESKTGELKNNLAPQKTKAANIAYDKTVALDTVLPTETTVITPTEILPSVTVMPTNTSISPTEIILAYNNTTATPIISPSPTSADSYLSPSVTVAKTKTLPESGFINNAIIMFVAAGLIIFFSFMF